MALGGPKRRRGGQKTSWRWSRRKSRTIPSGLRRQNRYVAGRRSARPTRQPLASYRISWPRGRIQGFEDVKVIASSIRKGNIIERDDGQLYVVLSAESFHPGKGTPTTQIDMRRISDGVKVSDRFKTTEQVERAYVEDSNYNYLYQDGNDYTFMNADTYDQVTVPAEVIGDQAVYLQEGMTCILSVFN